MAPRPHAPGRRHARGFTLVELVLASALAAIVLIGLQSAVLIASKAIPSPIAPTDAAAHARAVDRLALELSYAVEITASTATSITFTLADRDGDAAADTVAYSWTGTSGDPLVRVFNGSAPEVILEDVRALSFAFTTQAVAGDSAYQESGEVLLASHSSASNLADFTIDTLKWAGQLVPVSLPGAAVDFRTTRVRITADGASSATGTSCIELRSVRNRLPSARVLATASFSEPSSQTVMNCPLSTSRYLDVNEPVALIVRPTAEAPSCDLVYRSSGAAASTGLVYTTTNAGATWSSSSSGALLYELWGVYRTATDPESLTVAVFLRASVRAGSASAFELNLPLPNRPEVPS